MDWALQLPTQATPGNHYLWQLKVAYLGEQTKLGIVRVIVLPEGKQIPIFKDGSCSTL